MFTMTMILKMSLMKRKTMGFMPYQNSRKSLLIERNTWKNSWKYFIKLDESQKNFGSSIKTIFCDYCFNKDINVVVKYTFFIQYIRKELRWMLLTDFWPKKVVHNHQMLVNKNFMFYSVYLFSVHIKLVQDKIKMTNAALVVTIDRMSCIHFRRDWKQFRYKLDQDVYLNVDPRLSRNPIGNELLHRLSPLWLCKP